MHDPLDKKIDGLLASRPLQPSEEATARLLQDIQSTTPLPASAQPVFGRILRWTLPLAAAATLVIGIGLTQRTAPPPTIADSLSAFEAEELLFLESALAGLDALDHSGSPEGDLLETFEILYLEI